MGKNRSTVIEAYFERIFFDYGVSKDYFMYFSVLPKNIISVFQIAVSDKSPRSGDWLFNID